MLPILQAGANTNAALYNQALTSVYTMWGRINNPDYALARDPEIWTKCQRDATIAQAISTRLHMIAARDWSVEPGVMGAAKSSDRIAASVVDELLRNIRGFSEARLQLATACFRSRSYAFIEGRDEVRTFGDGVARKWFVPYRLRDVDPRRVEYWNEPYVDEEGRRRIAVVVKLWSAMRGAPEDLSPADRRRFISIIYKQAEDNNSYGTGMLSSIYFLWWFKSIVFKEGLQGLERWSQGVLVGKVASDREGSTGKTNEDIRDELFEALRDMRSRNVIVMSEDESIEVHDGGAAGQAMVLDMVRYCDEKLLSLILGSVLPFGGAETTGSYARAEIEQATSNALIRFDIDKMDESLTEHLIGYLWARNAQNIADLGASDAAIPAFKTSIAEREDTVEASAMVATLSGLGLPLKTAEVYRRTGFSQPGDDDTTFIGAAPAAPGLPFSAKDWKRADR